MRFGGLFESSGRSNSSLGPTARAPYLNRAYDLRTPSRLMMVAGIEVINNTLDVVIPRAASSAVLELPSGGDGAGPVAGSCSPTTSTCIASPASWESARTQGGVVAPGNGRDEAVEEPARGDSHLATLTVDPGCGFEVGGGGGGMKAESPQEAAQVSFAGIGACAGEKLRDHRFGHRDRTIVDDQLGESDIDCASGGRSNSTQAEVSARITPRVPVRCRWGCRRMPRRPA